MSRLDAEAVRTAYRRQAATYDSAFGLVSRAARFRAIQAVNALPGRDVLEVGVGTGLALPHYDTAKKITGIDLSADMLALARARAAQAGLCNVVELVEANAEATHFPEASFDIAASMFVASVVPNPRQLLAELYRVVRPGGHIVFINHFLARKGLRRVIEQAMRPLSHTLGWHPDFAESELFGPSLPPGIRFEPAPPFGIFTLVTLPR